MFPKTILVLASLNYTSDVLVWWLSASFPTSASNHADKDLRGNLAKNKPQGELMES